MPTIFQVVTAGYWEKFSISNNRASDKPHWLRYCHCAKLVSLFLNKISLFYLLHLHLGFESILIYVVGLP